MFSSVAGKFSTGGSGAVVRDGHPHGAADGGGGLLPVVLSASTVSPSCSGRGKLSLIMRSSCRHDLLMNRADNSLTMWRSCLAVLFMLPLTVMSTGMAPSTVRGLLSAA